MIYLSLIIKGRDAEHNEFSSNPAEVVNEGRPESSQGHRLMIGVTI